MRFTKILATAGVITLAALGAQFVVAQVASAHEPSASITCTTWTLTAQSYTGVDNTYGYSIDGAAEVTATFATDFTQGGTFADGSGNHTLVAHVYANNAPPPAEYSQTYDLSTSGCAAYLPIPAAPQPTGPTCTEAGVATVPSDTDTVHWSLNGNVATATAQNGNHFTDGTSTTSFTETVLPKLNPNGEDCAVHVTAQAPAFADGNCDTAPSVTGATEGTGYTVSTDGTPGYGNTVTVTFTANPNYRLDGQQVYTFHYAAKPDCRTAGSPVTPAVTQATCDHTTGLDSGFSITPATTDGIAYSVDGLLVTATATDDHKLGTLPNGWTSVSDTVATYLATQTDPECLVDVDLGMAAATFNDDVCRADGAAGGSYTLLSNDDVAYYVNGTETAAGTYPAADGSSVTITAQPRSGYTLVGTSSWSHTFRAVSTCAQVSSTHLVKLPPASPPTAAAATTVPLASTGVATLSLLLIAGLLALVGGALCIGANDRRWSRS